MILLRGGHAAAIALLLLVSAYYLLASVPFARYHFLEFAHFWWLPWLVRFHPLVMGAGTGLLLLSLGGVPRPRRVRLALAGGMSAVWMGVLVGVPALNTYENAMAMSTAPLLVCAAAAILDLVTHREAFERARVSRMAPRQLLAIAALAGFVASAIYLLVGLMAASGVRRLGGWELLIGGAGAVLGHEFVFVLPVLALVGLRALGARFRWPSLVEWAVMVCGLSVLAAFVIRRIALSTLLMRDEWAVAYSLLLGVSMVLSWQAMRMHRTPTQNAPLAVAPRTRWGAALTCLVVTAVSVAVLPGMLVLADWGMVLQKSLVIVSWIACGLFVSALSPRLRIRVLMAGVVTIVVAAILTVRTFAAVPDAPSTSADLLDIRMTLERYASVDHALATILDVVRPAVSDRDFFTALRDTGDVTDVESLGAVPLPIVSALDTPPAYRPHVFVIVVDSLRPDYIGAYDPSAAAFSPAITDFARDAIVMRNAYSPYAGTGLSQPAIWVGGLVPRVNYAQPFSVLNNLEQLLDKGGYRKYVSMDDISKMTLAHQETITNLDRHPENHEDLVRFDLCSTAPELIAQLDRDGSDTRPIFAYTRPLNVHIRVLANESRSYKGVRFGDREFFQPAVNAIRRVDACFGTFIEALKAKGLYDDSVIVLTSDHGDSYGDEGRWGHAFYLVPDTLRVPLLMHVPSRLREGRSWSTEAVTLTTDITPTLYDVLGYGYAPTSPLLGRTLAPRDPFAARADDTLVLVQSSYSRVFGIIDGGRWLYVASANHVSDNLFDLRRPGTVEVQLSAVDRIRYRQRLFELLGGLNAHYVAR